MRKWIARCGWRRIVWTVVAMVLVIGPFRFHYFSVCGDCGAVRNSSERQIPVFPFPYWRSHAIQETVLSRTVARLGLIGQHEHRWLFGHGGGNGIQCALGSGRHIRKSADSDLVAIFLENTWEYEGEESAGEWLAFALSPDDSQRMWSALSLTKFPEVGCTSTDEYRAWRTAAAENLVND
ncbi:MAG: hypothetical protein ACKV0T_10085 [Planctomycetales bacterium]